MTAGVQVTRGGGISPRALRGIEAVAIPVLALLASAAVFSVFLLALGTSPVQFFNLIWLGGFGSAFSVQNTLTRAAPLILTGLAFAIPAQIGLTVIGAEGALVLGGLAAAAAAIPPVTAGVAPVIGLPLMPAVAMAAGYGFAGILAAFLARQNALAVIPVAILFGALAASGGLIQRRMALPDATVLLLRGLIFVVLLASEMF